MINTDRTKILESKLLVRFQHCDPLGHLNNAAYIDYFLNAREDQLLEYYNVDTYRYAMQTGLAWVVANHNINYLFPLKVKDNVKIISQAKSFTNKSLVVFFEMFLGERKCAEMTTTFVHIDVKTGKPVNHSKEWMAFFEEVLNE